MSFRRGPKLLEVEEVDRGIVLPWSILAPFEALPYWLRNPATSVRADPPQALRSLTDQQYSLTPPAGVPVFIFSSDLTPIPRFSHIRKILGPGRPGLFNLIVKKRAILFASAPLRRVAGFPRADG